MSRISDLNYSITTSHKSANLEIPLGTPSTVAQLNLTVYNTTSTLFIDINADQGLPTMLDGIEYTFNFTTVEDTFNTKISVFVETE